MRFVGYWHSIKKLKENLRREKSCRDTSKSERMITKREKCARDSSINRDCISQGFRFLLKNGVCRLPILHTLVVDLAGLLWLLLLADGFKQASGTFVVWGFRVMNNSTLRCLDHRCKQRYHERSLGSA